MIRNLASTIFVITSLVFAIESYCQTALVESKISKRDQKKFIKHFKCLDICAASNPTDTIFRCCKQAIDFMVTKTDIEITAEIISSIGRTSFTKTDLQNCMTGFQNEQ